MAPEPRWTSSNDWRPSSSVVISLTATSGRAVRRAAEGDDRSPLVRAGHRGDEVVVGVEHGGAVGGQRLDDLALGLRDRLAAAELPDVGGADVEDRGDLRAARCAHSSAMCPTPRAPISTTR